MTERPREQHTPTAGGELGTTAAVQHRRVEPDESRRASRHWWDLDADNYVAEHAADLGDVDLLWCPEGLRESDVQLLGPTPDLVGTTILEVGCGTAPVSRWLQSVGANAVGFDLSGGMLRHALRLNAGTGIDVPLVQADACRFPFADASFDFVVSAFGAIAFVARPEEVMAEAARVLRPGGRFVFSTNHPIRWIFPDSPSARDLQVHTSYFDPRAYLEVDDNDRPTYIETHRTIGQRVRDIVAAGLVLDDIIEPEWVPGRQVVWGQWSSDRAKWIPGTAIYAAHKPAR
ncbi:methyltransferase family protein [Antricoccus suffuscus]|uniref:Methyltransferase family protein n=1 Tax=Antricoccus suffuscus TaxID=1629062 RepID=A0A2T0ZW55_9ACTN|nr:class I SAM-dependent methyltransferase [Antricoccus suffuscus]PRZ40589.1 methyltransferase family protein [Antricoccus suffuscus]